MTAHLALYGRPGRDPHAIETRSGKPMVAATIAVEIGPDGAAWGRVQAGGGACGRGQQRGRSGAGERGRACR